MSSGIAVPSGDAHKEAPSTEELPSTVPPLDILLVEDRPGQRELLEECLALEGHRVIGVSGGRKAIEKLRSGHFDLVITDRAMPDMNGREVATRVKEMTPGLPVILITGYGITPEDNRYVDLVLPKPVGLRDLRQAIARVHSERIE